MSRSRMIAAGLTAGALLAVSLAGCAKAVTGTPVAASAPTTHSAPTSQPGGSGGSGGTGNTAADRFCATITPDMVQQAFGVSGAQVTTGKTQNTNGVLAVNCTIAQPGGGANFAINVIGFDFAGQQNVTSQSALQNAQTQATNSGGTNIQQQTGIGNADGAFSYQITSSDGVTSYSVFAAKDNQGNVSASDCIAAGTTPSGPVQLSQLIKFATLVDNN